MTWHGSFAEGYMRRLLDAADPKSEARKIANEIAVLRYNGGRGDPLTPEDKEQLFREMESLAKPRRKGELEGGGFVGVAGDNRSYLSVVEAIRALVGGKK